PPVPSAFVVEQQPSTPNAGKRPLVLRTAGKFSTRARLLVRLHDRNHGMEARIHIDRWDTRRGEGPLVVTEELHLITFTLAYAYCGLELELEATTLPFVIISNNNQFSSAWASILWFNMLSSDPKAQQFFSSPPPAPWPRLAEVLSWQFQSVAERGLSRDNLLMLAKKLLGSKPSPDSAVAWPKFSKDGPAGFSFWAWLDGILGLIQEHLKQLWKNGLILGFVSHKQAEKLLKSRRTGTFLLRFSESVLGGVTFTWVEHHETGSPTFHAVEPYTASELVSLALPDIIRDYHMSLEEKNPENPLKFLYPSTPRDEAFGPFYSQRLEGSLSESQKYLNRRLIRVSSRPPSKQQTEEELAVATENLETLRLQPRGQGTPGGLGTPQGLGTPRGLGTPGGLGTPQRVATSPGTPQVTPGSLGTPQVIATNQGTLQVVAMSPGTLQVTSGSLGTLQGVATSPGTPQRVATSPGTPQVTPGSLGTPQVIATNQGTLQVVAMSPGTLQVTSGSLGTLQGVATSPGTPQVVATNPGIPQVTPGTLGTPQVVATSPGTLQVTGLGTLHPQSLEPPQVPSAVPSMQGTLQVTPGAVGPVQVLPGGLQVLQVCPEDLGTLQGTVGTLQLGAAEPPRVPEEQGTLPAELRDLELLPGGQDMQELLQGSQDVQELLLQSLEGLEAAPGTPGTLGTLGTLGVAELMPDVVATLEESLQLSPGSAALLDQHDPFLPQPEDAAVPSVPSLFTDFPPLHIDASDFQ
ncbi:uncharacterized protein LOC120513580, partial [Passer montanus]|uniref:uncharacterized protein LOC120513580 n=1 Tax=Passer montanus TaxID=9160 RepID=UPI00196143DA